MQKLFKKLKFFKNFFKKIAKNAVFSPILQKNFKTMR